MRSAAKTTVAALAAFAAIAPFDGSCNRCAPPRDADVDGGDADVAVGGAEQPLPALPPTVERLAKRTPGTVGPLTFPDARPIALRGAIERDATGAHFRSHTAVAAAAIGESWVLVVARSGVWLLERATLAVRARLETNAEGDVAVSPDQGRFAFGRCAAGDRCTLEVRAFPSLEVVASIAIDRPHRLRFSPDGARIAVASTKKNTATLVDLASRAVVARLVENSDVNDVVVLRFGSLIAYGTNEDETVVHDFGAHRDVWRDRPTVRGGAKRGFDQNAVAYDAASDTLYTGGNDDTVWRISGIRSGAPKALPGGLGFANDVLDLAVLPSGRLLVALDSGSAEIVAVAAAEAAGAGAGESAGERAAKPWGQRLGVLGHSIALVSYGGRVGVSRDDVVGVLGGVVVRWDVRERGGVAAAAPPRRGCSRRASSDEPLIAGRAVKADRFAAYGSWNVDEGAEDTVLVAPTPGGTFEHTVLRVTHRPADPLDVETTTVGVMSFETHSPEIVSLADGTRVVLGKGAHESLRIYRLPPGGGLSSAVDVDDVRYVFSVGRVHRGDGSRLAYVGKDDAVLEIDAAGQRRVGALRGDERLSWDPAKATWTACYWKCRALP